MTPKQIPVAEKCSHTWLSYIIVRSITHLQSDFHPKAAQILKVQYIRTGHLSNSSSKQVGGSISLNEWTNVCVYAAITEGLGRTG